VPAWAGSADAAFFINLLNENFSLNLNVEERIRIASRLGSDCAFFINNHPVLAVGRGDEFSKVHVDLSAYYILIVFPAIHSNTREAYSGLVPRKPADSLRNVIETIDMHEWRHHLVNDFEESIFKKYPAISDLKQMLYENGAVYASLSGSGSAVYGIFKTPPPVVLPPSYQHFLQKPASIIS
jgi:4-diphosphocytidyl-2-C-methyl-D-erythritol kinase